MTKWNITPDKVVNIATVLLKNDKFGGIKYKNSRLEIDLTDKYV